MMDCSLYIGLFVIMICHHSESIFISRNESLKMQVHHENHVALQPKKIHLKEDKNRLRSLTNAGRTNSNENKIASYSFKIHNDSNISAIRNNTDDDVLQPNLCSVQYSGVETTMNCFGLSLTSISSTWFSTNTTAISLDKNRLTVVDNVSFSCLSRLRYLGLSHNKIVYIQENAFRDLQKLEILNLEHNKLNQYSYPPGIFDPLFRIKFLFLRRNKEMSNLPGSLFTKLNTLLYLTVDAVGESFIIDTVLTNVTKLVVSGNAKVIDHNSFTTFPNTRELTIAGLPSLNNFNDTALHPLQSLKFLSVNDMYIGIAESLQILKPFTCKNMTSISFSRVYFMGKSVDFNFYKGQGILNAEKTQYLTNICVKHLSLAENRLYVITVNAFSGDLFSNCIRSIDLSSNRLTGYGLVMAFASHFKHIEVINLENEVRTCNVEDKFYNDRKEKSADVLGWRQIPIFYHSGEFTEYGTAYSEDDSDNTLMMKIEEQQNKYIDTSSKKERTNVAFQEIILGSEALVKCNASIPPEDSRSLPMVRVYTSTSLKYFKAKGITMSRSFYGNVIFVGGSNLHYLDMSDCGLKIVYGNVVGLDMLQTLMLSGNDLSKLSETVLDGLCHLVELDLSNCHLHANFMSSQSARMFQNLHDLKRLDLSSNFLNALKNGTFGPNKLIEELDFSRNRFRNIPFELANTPNLKYLNLQENSITALELHETNHIDRLATQPAGFRLLLSGNILSCGCSNLRFLVWLQTTSARLDNGRNFTCMTDEGHLSYLSNVTDIETLWRRCWGRPVLFLSLSLFCSMVTGYLILFLVWKNKTFLASKVLQILTGYKLKTPEDYPIGVYIGYSVNDYIFPCFVLRKFIEEELSLTTYVYNRDNIPNSDRASGIVDAINGCWRIILVVTDNFLREDEWAMFTTRTAIYGLSPANPARVVVLVHEDLQYSLPPEVLTSVPEENILVLSSWTISDDLHRKLRNCLKEL